MKPRDRVLAAVNGKEILPVPVDVFENWFHPRIQTDLQRRLGLSETDREELLRALGAELRWGFPIYVGPPLEEAPFQSEATYPFTKVYRGIWGTWEGLETYTEEFYRPLAAVESVAEVEAYAWPDPDWFDYGTLTWQGKIMPVAEWAQQTADYARVVGGFNPVFSRVMELYGFETGLVNTALRPDLIRATVAKIGAFLEVYYQRLAESVRGHADFLGMGDDFADTKGVMIHPDRWREIYLPLWKRLFDIAHRNGLKPLMHMCGSVRAVLGDLIDAGLEVFEVVQVTAHGMDPVELKREFGNHVTFYGAINTQNTLPHGSTEDVRREVRDRVDVLGRGGRYILSSMHVLMDDVPVENVLAMYDEARTYRPQWSL